MFRRDVVVTSAECPIGTSILGRNFKSNKTVVTLRDRLTLARTGCWSWRSRSNFSLPPTDVSCVHDGAREVP